LGNELQLRGAEAVFVGSGIFMKDSTTFADPVVAEKRARAIVQAAAHFNDPKVLLEVSEDLFRRRIGGERVAFGKVGDLAPECL
jgi:pyridoxal biosynthesis lyase PdxS